MAKINLQENNSSSVKILEEGTYQAVISAAWDLGMQENTYLNETSMKHKIMFRFEINELIEDEGPFKGKRYNLLKEINVPEFFGDKAAMVALASSAEGRTLTKDDFKNFDTDNLIGKNLMVATGFTTGGKAKILSFSKLMKGLIPIVPELTPEMPSWVAEKAGTGALNNASVSDLPPVEAYSAPSAPEDDLPF